MTSTAVRPSIAAGTYRIDASRTTVRFAIRELFGLMTCRGTFSVREGVVVVSDDPTRSLVRVVMDPASFKTDKPKRDTDVKGPHFLDVENHPEMSFASTRLEQRPEGWLLTGTLRVHGRSAPVTLRLVDGAQTAGGCRFAARTTIDRTMFGVTKFVGLIHRDLAVEIEVHANRS